MEAVTWATLSFGEPTTVPLAWSSSAHDQKPGAFRVTGFACTRALVVAVVDGVVDVAVGAGWTAVAGVLFAGPSAELSAEPSVVLHWATG
jgi:hypothetical protein